jgi:Resolvase, N terminal domain
VWKLDRLSRDLRHLINTVHDLTKRGVGLKELTGQGAAIDTTTPAGKLIFGIFAALADIERELIVERTKAGRVAARARGRLGGRRPKLTAKQIAMGRHSTTAISTLWPRFASSWAVLPPRFVRPSLGSAHQYRQPDQRHHPDQRPARRADAAMFAPYPSISNADTFSCETLPGATSISNRELR